MSSLIITGKRSEEWGVFLNWKLMFNPGHIFFLRVACKNVAFLRSPQEAYHYRQAAARSMPFAMISLIDC